MANHFYSKKEYGRRIVIANYAVAERMENELVEAKQHIHQHPLDPVYRNYYDAIKPFVDCYAHLFKKRQCGVRHATALDELSLLAVDYMDKDNAVDKKIFYKIVEFRTALRAIVKYCKEDPSLYAEVKPYIPDSEAVNKAITKYKARMRRERMNKHKRTVVETRTVEEIARDILGAQ